MLLLLATDDAQSEDFRKDGEAVNVVRRRGSGQFRKGGQDVRLVEDQVV